MSSALATYNLGSCHSKRAVGMPRHSARDSIKVRRPATARLEFMSGFIERSIAAGAGVDAARGHVFVVCAGVRGFSAFLAEDAELFCGRILIDRNI